MSETPDLFRNLGGTLIPAFSDTLSHQKQSAVPTQKALLENPTNLSGGLLDRRVSVEGVTGNALTGEKSLPDSSAQNSLLPVDVQPEPFSLPKAGGGEARESTSKISGIAGNSLGGQQLFDGSTYVPTLDESRLKAQIVRVRELMRDGRWRSLSEIAEVTGDPEASISARLRDLRKPRHGLWTVKRIREGGLFYYQLGGKGL